MNVSVYLTHPTVPCFNFSDTQRMRLEQALPGLAVARFERVPAFLESLAQAQIAIVWRFEQAWLERAPELEWIVTPAAGHDYFHVVPPPGVEVDYGSFHGPLIGETVIGMLLGHYRGLFAADRLRTEQLWPRPAVAGSMRTLHGARLTILGFGAIGRWIGRLAKPFGVRICGVSRRMHAAPDYFDDGDRVLAVGDLDACLPQTDALVLALPATPETDRIIDARRLALLPADAVILNIGRGNAIGEHALAAALDARELGAALLDVFAVEPLPASSPLRTAANAYLFPHMSAVAPQYLDLFVDELIGKLEHRYGERLRAMRASARTQDDRDR